MADKYEASSLVLNIDFKSRNPRDHDIVTTLCNRSPVLEMRATDLVGVYQHRPHGKLTRMLTKIVPFEVGLYPNGPIQMQTEDGMRLWSIKFFHMSNHHP
jgi:hypothetical protein